MCVINNSICNIHVDTTVQKASSFIICQLLSIVCVLVEEKPKKLLVYVNPCSGKGNGLTVNKKYVEPILKLANVEVQTLGKFLCVVKHQSW